MGRATIPRARPHDQPLGAAPLPARSLEDEAPGVGATDVVDLAPDRHADGRGHAVHRPHFHRVALQVEGQGLAPVAHEEAQPPQRLRQARLEPQDVAPQLEAAATLDLAGFLSAWLAVRECPMWTGAIAIRRDALFEAGLFPEGRAVRGGDKDLWLRVLAKGRLRYDPRVTAVFHRDSDNKVSKSTTTLDLPCLVETARRLMTGATAEEVGLLRRLVNQEIAHYARYAMKYPGRTAIGLGDLYLPEGAGAAALLIAAKLIPASVRQSGYALRNRLLARA